MMKELLYCLKTDGRKIYNDSMWGTVRDNEFNYPRIERFSENLQNSGKTYHATKNVKLCLMTQH